MGQVTGQCMVYIKKLYLHDTGKLSLVSIFKGWMLVDSHFLSRIGEHLFYFIILPVVVYIFLIF